MGRFNILLNEPPLGKNKKAQPAAEQPVAENEKDTSSSAPPTRVRPSGTVPSRNRATAQPRSHATKPPQDSVTTPLYSQELIEKLRRVVKQIGKETTTFRLTPEEKKALKAIDFEYSNNDVQTSSTEIVRIAINFLLEDYAQHKRDSLLSKVLNSLRQ